MNQIPNIEEWEKEFDEVLETVDSPENYYLKVKAFIHQELQKARAEEGERIIKAIRADKNENAENGGEWANGYNAGKFIAVFLAHHSELDQDINNTPTK